MRNRCYNSHKSHTTHELRLHNDSHEEASRRILTFTLENSVAVAIHFKYMYNGELVILFLTRQLLLYLHTLRSGTLL